MAAADLLRIRVTGRGGHGAMPHTAIDPVLASAQIVTALQSIVSRSVSPLETAVLSITSIHGGEAFNVIPPAVEMLGTVRTFLPEVRALVLERLQAVVDGIACALGCQAEIDVQRLTPPLINSAQFASQVRQAAASVLPEHQVETGFRTMGSEDMAFMMQEVPGCFFLIGSANPGKGLDAAHHHPRFDIDEEALPQAAALMAAAALDFLKD
jgi:amidohydrolase